MTKDAQFFSFERGHFRSTLNHIDLSALSSYGTITSWTATQ
jgi:hypothetical protein